MRKRRLSKQIQGTCSKCGESKGESRNTQGYCKKCHAAYMRKNRKRHSELTPEQRKRANARSYLNVYIRRGNILKQPCSVCGELKAEAHHADYSKPLEVIWVCRKCHLEHHRNEKTI